MARPKKKMKKGVKLFLILVVLAIVGIGGYFAYKVFIKGEDIKLPINTPKETVPEKKLQIVDVNSKTRPYAVMINNLSAARPYQSGLQDAIVMYEIIVEGGITRMLAVFKDATNVERIGTIRSARHYFLDYALEHDAIYVHWGWSPQARSDISSLGVTTISTNNSGSAFYRDNTYKASSEHRGVTKMSNLIAATKKRKLRDTTEQDLLLNYSVDPIKLDSMENAIKADEVVVSYSASYKSGYSYDSENQVYKRFVNGKEHKDYITKKQFTFKNLIVYDVKNSALAGAGKGRQDISNIGSGEGYYITNGYAVPITWSKSSRKAQTVYKYENGKEIDVNDGNTFIQIYPKGQKLSIKEVQKETSTN